MEGWSWGDEELEEELRVLGKVLIQWESRICRRLLLASNSRGWFLVIVSRDRLIPGWRHVI